MDKIIKIGIIGAGRIGRLHTENIVSNFRNVKIKTLADLFMNEEIEKWAKTMGIENTTKNADEIFNDNEINAILICSSSNTHADFIIKAAKSKKHIFCEKPIDHNIEKINLALKEVKKANVKLQVGFVRRFDHNHKKVADTVRNGRIGDVHIVKITSRDPEPPSIEYLKSSGGLFFDQTIHDFDMARYLAGSEVEEVTALANVLVDTAIGDIDDVDTSIVTLKFKNGALGVIDNSRKAVYGYDQRTEVFGSKGCVMTDNDTPNRSIISTVDGVICEKPPWFFLERYNGAFIEEIKEFINMIINETEPSVTGIDGLKPVIIAMAAYKSLKEKRTVRIDEINQ